MKPMKQREVVSMLASEGFTLASQGEHSIYANANGIRIPVPHHRVIAAGTLRDIIKAIRRAKAMANNSTQVN